MKDIGWETSEELRRNKAIQHALGALENGLLGNQTLTEACQIICPDVFPISVKMYGMPTLISKDIIPFDPNGPLRNYNNAISGSYSYLGKPSSILIQNGKTICGSSSHAWLGYPDSVIYEYFDGTIGICRVMYDTQIPNRDKVKWAIGGTGLLGNFAPEEEGYCMLDKNNRPTRNSSLAVRKYNDVFRPTNNVILGIKGDYKYGVLGLNMGDKNLSGASFNNFSKNKMQFEKAIKIDGGHIGAINTPDFKVNIDQVQAYGIQFV